MQYLLSSLLVLQTTPAGELPFDEETFLIVSVVSTIVFLLIAIGVGYWMYKDAAPRENNELVWAAATGILLFMFFPIGIILLVAYFVVRGEKDPPESTDDQSAGEEW